MTAAFRVLPSSRTRRNGECLHGICLVDPSGNFADSIVGLVPRSRTNDVILFDAGSRDCPVSFNPLPCRDDPRIDQVTLGVVSAMKKLYDLWGPRQEDTLRNAVFVVVERGSNLLSMMQLLGEKAYREKLVPLICDPIVGIFPSPLPSLRLHPIVSEQRQRP